MDYIPRDRWELTSRFLLGPNGSIPNGHGVVWRVWTTVMEQWKMVRTIVYSIAPDSPSTSSSSSSPHPAHPPPHPPLTLQPYPYPHPPPHPPPPPVSHFLATRRRVTSLQYLYMMYSEISYKFQFFIRFPMSLKCSLVIWSGYVVSVTVATLSLHPVQPGVRKLLCYRFWFLKRF